MQKHGWMLVEVDVKFKSPATVVDYIELNLKEIFLRTYLDLKRLLIEMVLLK